MLLFMVPADSKNIKGEYEILVNELKMYNPELLDKKRVLAISKSDMLDEELMNEIRKDLPDIPRVFHIFTDRSGNYHSERYDLEST